MGLDVELFPESVEDEFICGLCSQVLLNPVTAGCSHIFCQTCVKRKLKSHVTKAECPSCSAQLVQETTDTSVDFKLKLLTLRIACSHKCGHSFELGDLPDHMDICPNAPVQCSFKLKGCKKTVKRMDLRKHMEECDFRTVECEACGVQTLYCDLFTHQSKVRCLEKKLKQQIIRERKAASMEINRHREKLFRDNARLDQQQRKKILSHAKDLNNRKLTRHHNKMDEHDSDFEFSPRVGVFMTETKIQNGSLVENQNANGYVSRSHQEQNHVSRTPHSSRSGFVLQSCAQCNKMFRADTNSNSACRWHTGPMIEVFGGTCFACGRLDYQPGCALGYHRP